MENWVGLISIDVTFSSYLKKQNTTFYAESLTQKNEFWFFVTHFSLENIKPLFLNKNPNYHYL